MHEMFLKSNYASFESFKRSRENNKKKQKADIKLIVEEAKKPCLFCGSEDDIHFHHTNPTTMKFRLSQSTSRSKKQVREEIDKCWCLCEECHTKLHQRLLDPLPHLYDTL